MIALPLSGVTAVMTLVVMLMPSAGPMDMRHRPFDAETGACRATSVRPEDAGISHTDTPPALVRSPDNIHVPLSKDQQSHLESYGWSRRVENERGVWVSVDEQTFRIIENGRIVWQAPCSTAEKGVGSEMNSFRTPLGWHSVARKTGKGASWGRVFRAGRPTEVVWKPGDDTSEDLVLTRILFLKGEEPGKNKGGNLDSLARGIYIHGTNAEGAIGQPVSHGCVRLRNDDIIEAFDLVPEGAPVLITHGPAPRP